MSSSKKEPLLGTAESGTGSDEEHHHGCWATYKKQLGSFVITVVFDLICLAIVYGPLKNQGANWPGNPFSGDTRVIANATDPASPPIALAPSCTRLFGPLRLYPLLLVISWIGALIPHPETFNPFNTVRGLLGQALWLYLLITWCGTNSSELAGATGCSDLNSLAKFILFFYPLIVIGFVSCVLPCILVCMGLVIVADAEEEAKKEGEHKGQAKK